MVHISDRYMPPRAVAVLPGVLQIRHDSISPRRSLPSRVRFGPVLGVTKHIFHSEATKMVEESRESKFPLFLLKGDQHSVTHIDVTDKDKSNWLGLLPLGDQTTANIWLYEENNELYALTTKAIPARTPLILGYSSDYVKIHKFPPESPCLDLREALSSLAHEWRCYECKRALPSAALLQNHMDFEHKDNKVISHQRHRCHRCKKTFTRLFTLKRHRTRHCTDKDEKPSYSMKLTAEMSPNTELEGESNCRKLSKSQEMSKDIQNFTSNIDFNSLLDAYRISNLNLSNTSKSGKDLIDPQDQLHNNNSSSVEDSLTKITTDTEVNSCQDKSIVNEESIQVTNNYVSECNKNLNSYKTQEYVSEISKEMFSCECGHVFLNKDKLIQHIMDHCNSTKMIETSDIMYKCEDCQLIFKRRGMFVNHLWRVHQNTTTRVPLERRLQHYPCAACPALYRSAAKRRRHFDKHHPDVSGVDAGAGGCVQRGRRAAAAAACAACPRQYATRAKLLQHVRRDHPHAHTTPNTRAVELHGALSENHVGCTCRPHLFLPNNSSVRRCCVPV
ncbi:uncharacterized protein [Epargyreus clarus]|uniref:uncharacterized protein isoform X2 n=1 Tax=Epargyreus clarus TaxID=520877 RepID=UPI003C2CF284